MTNTASKTEPLSIAEECDRGDGDACHTVGKEHMERGEHTLARIAFNKGCDGGNAAACGESGKLAAQGGNQYTYTESSYEWRSSRRNRSRRKSKSLSSVQELKKGIIRSNYATWYVSLKTGTAAKSLSASVAVRWHTRKLVCSSCSA